MILVELLQLKSFFVNTYTVFINVCFVIPCKFIIIQSLISMLVPTLTMAPISKSNKTKVSSTWVTYENFWKFLLDFYDGPIVKVVLFIPAADYVPSFKE